ncbi:MAG TPA: triose-phosphate isomerase [Caulifigura sp.]|nr:triose-phosphate isomerase [Caulifigura sp.]
MRRYLVAGNWKMNTLAAGATALAKEVAAGAAAATNTVDVLVCPPFPYLLPVRDALAGSKVRLGAQNASHEAPGAFTGETAVDMLADCGCTSVLLGHSERRHIMGETDSLINKKLKAVCGKGLQAVLCVGELLAEREANKTEKVLDTQMAGGLEGVSEADLANVVIAYEPVWAIGTGKTASPEQAQAAHAHLRKWLASRYNPAAAQAMRILYGGSVKADNALTLMQQPDIDGALVGGASLTGKAFLPIIEAAASASK